MPLTEYQQRAVDAVRGSIFTTSMLLVGGAGTGKSRTAVAIVKALAKATDCLILVVCAAAAPLDKYRSHFPEHGTEYLNVRVLTLQSLVGIKPSELATGFPTRTFKQIAKVGGSRFGPIPDTKKVVLVVEECFAASSELVNQAMQSLALLPHAGRSAGNVHALLVGCPHQMAAVGGSCVFHADVFHDAMRPVRRLVLTENKRCANASAGFLRLLHLLRYWLALGISALREADAELIGMSQRGLPRGDSWIDSVKLTATNAAASRLNAQEATLRYRRGEGTVIFMGYEGNLSEPEHFREPASNLHAVLWMGDAVVAHPGGVDAVALDDDNVVTKIPNSAKIQITQLSTQRGIEFANQPDDTHLYIRCDDLPSAVIFVKYGGRAYRIDALHEKNSITKEMTHFMPITMMGAITINRAQGQDISGRVCIMMHGVLLPNVIDHVYTALTRATSEADIYLAGYEPGSIVKAGEMLLQDTNPSAETFRAATKAIDRVELAQIKSLQPKDSPPETSGRKRRRRE